MIVADANLIGYLLLEGAETRLAEEVYESDPVWSVPVLWRSEVRNVLVMHMRQRALPASVALSLYEQAERLVSSREHMVGAVRVLELAAKSSCSAYDCEYVALADELGVRLVTFDRQLQRAFPGIAVAPAEFRKGRR